MRGIDLVGATSTAEVLSRLRDGLAKARTGETVFGSVGWRAPLDELCLDRMGAERLIRSRMPQRPTRIVSPSPPAMRPPSVG